MNRDVPPYNRSPQIRKGRGAVSNPANRYDRAHHHGMDDGWGTNADDALPPLRTHVHVEQARHALSKNASPDLPFDYSLNPYRGCEHGCIYCYARPGHAYQGLSPGLDFETNLFAKGNIAEALRQDLAAPKYRCKPINIAGVTDPYQPIERTYGLTRSILEVLWETRHPVAIITRSANILHDLDILSLMAEQGLVQVAVSLTTLDSKLARLMEPRAPQPTRRLMTIEALSAAGIPVTVMTAPMIPHLNDHEMENLLTAAHDKGAVAAAYTLIRLPLELKELFHEWLETHTPNRARHVLNGIKETRGGAVHNTDFKRRMYGTGTYADLLKQRFSLTCRRLGLNHRHAPYGALRTDLFRPPHCPRQKNEAQLPLF